MAEFPAFNGQSVSIDVLYFPAGSINPPHTRVRAARLLFLLWGTLQVGLIDTTNKLYSQTLQAGDMFVFPKGLVHYQYNPDAQVPALAIATFRSSNPGSVSIPNTLFNTSIDDNILAKSFKTDVATIQALKAGLAPKPWGLHSLPVITYNYYIVLWCFVFICLFDVEWIWGFLK